MIKNSINSYLKYKLNTLEKKSDKENILPLSFIQYDAKDILNSVNTLLRGWPTIGIEVKKVEQKIQKLLKIKNAVMLNSGGSANYLILYLLTSPYARKKHKLNFGDEIITPAVTWSTTVTPIIQNNLVPVLVDVNLSTYDICTNEIEKNITKKTKALMIVHPLGHVCNMNEIKKLCKKYSLILIEDTCESIGAKYKNQHAGTFGLFSSISMYQSHHISSVEGGLILTNDHYYADILRSMRANGWLREITDKRLKKKLIKANKKIDESFMFPFIGFNFKPTDMSAALVNRQIDKLNFFIKKRRLAAQNLIKKLKEFEDFLILPMNDSKNVENSWFTFPIVVKKNTKFDKEKITNYLTKQGIANRPIIAGNIADQPFIKDFKHKKGKLTNSKKVMSNGFFIGLNHRLSKKKVEYIYKVFLNFFKTKI